MIKCCVRDVTDVFSCSRKRSFELRERERGETERESHAQSHTHKIAFSTKERKKKEKRQKQKRKKSDPVVNWANAGKLNLGINQCNTSLIRLYNLFFKLSSHRKTEKKSNINVLSAEWNIIYDLINREVFCPFFLSFKVMTFHHRAIFNKGTIFV